MVTLEIFYMVNDKIEENKFSVDINPVMMHTYEVKEFSITSCPINNDDAAIIITADGKDIFEGVYLSNSTNDRLERYINQCIILSIKTIDSNGNEKYHINPMSKLSWQLGFTLYPQKLAASLLSVDIDNTHKIAMEMGNIENLLDEASDSPAISDEDLENLRRLLDNDEFDIDNL